MSSERRMPDWASGDEHGRLAEWAGEGRHKLAHAPRGAQKGPAMPNNGKHTAKAAALIALKRAQQEGGALRGRRPDRDRHQAGRG